MPTPNGVYPVDDRIGENQTEKWSTRNQIGKKQRREHEDSNSQHYLEDQHRATRCRVEALLTNSKTPMSEVGNHANESHNCQH